MLIEQKRPPLGAALSIVISVSGSSDDILGKPCGLLDDLGNHAGADGAAAFTDGEAQLLFHRDRGDQLDLAAGVDVEIKL